MKKLSPVTCGGGKKPVLLTVLAHPDDETFGTGGTLALYARRGVDVHLVCATRGEVGEMDPALLGNFTTIGDKREAELRCAAGTLGLAGVYFLGYRDSGMPGSPDNQHPQALVAQPIDKVAAKVAHYIRLLKPQVVITFDPIGGYRHPDHIAIHNATVKAFYAAGDASAYPDPDGLAAFSPEKLYFHTMPHGYLKVAVRVLRLIGRDPTKFGKNKDIDLTSFSEVEFPTHAVVDFRPVAKIREEAAACHASQGGGAMTGGLQGLIARLFNRGDSYMRAYPEPGSSWSLERDLFERT
jgi:N-acetyl-1-D-myo-inositol-2-amino-2-deoxy-alpha-D-glucopyranoside deacetylase